MITPRILNVLLTLLSLGVLLLSGCTNFLTPEIGVTARQDARIDLVEGGVQNGALNTDDVNLTYSFSESGNMFNLAGVLSFTSSLTNSFPMVKRFFLKMSFLDGEGRVLETINITPAMLNTYTGVEQQIPVTASCPKPAGASAIVFNYFGVFRGMASNDDGPQSDWNIFYFPFE
jgi:hypothetical protein